MDRSAPRRRVAPLRQSRHGHRRAPAVPRRHPRGDQPVDPAGGLQHVRGRPRADRGAAARGRRVGRGAGARGRRVRRLGAARSAGGSRRTRTRPGCARTIASATGSTRSSSTPPGTSCSARGSASASTPCRGASRSPARTSPGRRCSSRSQAEAGVGLPALDDLLGDPGAAQAARARRRVGAALYLARLRRRAAPRPRQARRPLRDGDDREAGRLGRARQHHHRDAGERRRARAPSTRSRATSGSCRRRCATRSWSSRRPRAGSPAS